MSHADRIWPALACLRRGELPSPAEVDALIALARGEEEWRHDGLERGTDAGWSRCFLLEATPERVETVKRRQMVAEIAAIVDSKRFALLTAPVSDLRSALEILRRLTVCPKEKPDGSR